MIDMRWVVTRQQEAGAFSTPLDWPDGSTVYVRLQYRETGLSGDAPWREISVISEITEAPRIALVRGGPHGGH